MAAVVCGHCGASNPAGSRFCESCDGFLDWEGAPAEEEPAPARQEAVRPPAARQEAAVAASPTTGAAARPPVTPAAGTSQPGPAPAATAMTMTPQQAASSSPSTPTSTPAGPPQSTTNPTLQLNQCSWCGTVNDPQRRFCHHCGDWLVTPSALPPTPPPTLRKRLRRRWWGGDRNPYQGSLTRSTIGFRILASVISLVVIGTVLTVAGFHPIRRLTDYAGHVRGTGRIEGVTATAEPAAGSPAEWVVDDVRGRGWSTEWTAASTGNPASACTDQPVPATAGVLTLTLPAPTDVREIGFEGGLPDGDGERRSRWRPKTIELRWDGGECQTVNLADSGGLQRFGVDRGTVRGVRVTIVAGYAPTPAKSRLVDIGEITFWHR